MRWPGGSCRSLVISSQKVVRRWSESSHKVVSTSTANCRPLTAGNLIACGFVTPTLPDTGIQSAWVIKLDSIGCEWAGCDTTVGIEETGRWGDKETGGKGEEGKRGELEIWPNPCREILNFKFSILNSGNEYSLVIYDIFGREVAEIIAHDRQDQIQINVESYPPGVYIVILRNGYVLLESSKFVVVR